MWNCHLEPHSLRKSLARCSAVFWISVRSSLNCIQWRRFRIQRSTVLMNSIIDNQRTILLSVEGTNIWSGQQPQQYNSQAIAWGGLRYLFFFHSPPLKFADDRRLYSHQLFSIGQRYQFVAWAYLIGFMVPVPFWIMYKLWPKLRTDYLYTPIIWCVEHTSPHNYYADAFTAATSLAGFVWASTHRSYLSSLLPSYLNGGWELAIPAGLISTTTLSPLLWMVVHKWDS